MLLLAFLRENGDERFREEQKAQRRKGTLSVEVKIGISESPRELVLNSSQTPDEVEELVRAALEKGSPVLDLTDERGRKILVQTSKVAYVEIGVADVRRVGFGG
jgi:hypothetical protein